MRCHYEVLELDRHECTIDDIKRQYKKMALKWHPDRNHGQEEYATDQFKQVTAAYSVLNDARERKWYDDHRESIIRGSNGTRANKDDDDDENADIIALWGFFSEACYEGMDDEEDGFYRVYRDVFDSLVQQENHVSAKMVDFPSFGDSTTADAQVKRFYNEWSNFISVLTFSWEDEYNPAEAADRRVRREIEKINKKARDNGRREYVDQILSLVEYVRKRDPRFALIQEAKEKKKEDEAAARVVAEEEKLARRAVEREKRMALHNSEEAIAQREAELEGAYLLAEHSSSDEDDAWGEIGGRVRRRRKQKKGNGVTSSMAGYDSDEADALLARLHMKGSTSDDAASQAQAQQAAAATAAFTCELCQKSFHEEKQLKQHYGSKPHKQMVKGDLKKNKKTGPVASLATVLSALPPKPGDEKVAPIADGILGDETMVRQKNNKKKLKDAVDDVEGMPELADTLPIPQPHEVYPKAKKGFKLKGKKGRSKPDSDEDSD